MSRYDCDFVCDRYDTSFLEEEFGDDDDFEYNTYVNDDDTIIETDHVNYPEYADYSEGEDDASEDSEM